MRPPTSRRRGPRSTSGTAQKHHAQPKSGRDPLLARCPIATGPPRIAPTPRTLSHAADALGAERRHLDGHLDGVDDGGAGHNRLRAVDAGHEAQVLVGQDRLGGGERLGDEPLGLLVLQQPRRPLPADGVERLVGCDPANVAGFLARGKVVLGRTDAADEERGPQEREAVRR